MVKAYQILTYGASNKSYSVDYVVASTVEATKTYNLRYRDELQNENWIAVPFDSTGITDSDTLVQSIASRFTPVDGDMVLVNIRDNATQSVNQGTMLYAGGWMSLGSQPIAVGSAVSMFISNNANPWTA